MAPIHTSPLPDDADTIRLLHIHPSPTFTDPLTCTLSTTKLSTEPVYAALSYVWGPPDFSACITVDGYVVRITENLQLSLRMFRDASRTRDASQGGGGVLWVDQVCVNQEDAEERGRQVAMMGKIYGGARSVAACLGDGDTGTVRLVNELMDTLATAYDTAVSEGHVDVETSLNLSQWINRSQWTNWTAFFSGPLASEYLLRAWVIQELVLNANKWILYGGEDARPFTWRTFAFAVNIAPWLRNEVEKSWTEEMHSWDTISHHYVPPSVASAHARNIASISKSGGRWELMEMLIHMRSLQSTDARDRIFALQGISSDAVHHPPPSYFKTTKQVYTEFARSYIERQLPNVELGRLLAEAGLHKQSHDVPRWVPDWIAEGSENTMNFHKRYELHHDTLEMYFAPGDVRTLSPIRFLDRSGHEALVVRGKLLGTVNAVSDKAPQGLLLEQQPSEAALWAQSCTHLIASLDQDSLDAGEREDVSDAVSVPQERILGALIRFAQLLTSHIFHPREDWDSPRDLHSEYPHLNAEQIVKGYELCLKPLTEGQGLGEIEKRLRRLYSSASIWTQSGHRRLGINTGGALSMLPAKAEVGDTLALIDGVLCGVVLRRHVVDGTPGWKLVGDAFIEGGKDCQSLLEEDLEDVVIF